MVLRRAVLGLLPLLGGCTVHTSSFYAPIRVEVAPPVAVADGDGFVVIRNLNNPRDCRAVPDGSVFPAIYAIVYGPADEGAARRFARRCRQ